MSDEDRSEWAPSRFSVAWFSVLSFAALRVTRDAILFCAGLAGIGYETVARASSDAGLLALFGAMLGLPLFLRFDEGRRDDEDMRRRRHRETRGKVL